jgi:regulator of replication initiation timing
MEIQEIKEQLERMTKAEHDLRVENQGLHKQVEDLKAKVTGPTSPGASAPSPGTSTSGSISGARSSWLSPKK